MKVNILMGGGLILMKRKAGNHSGYEG